MQKETVNYSAFCTNVARRLVRQREDTPESVSESGDHLHEIVLPKGNSFRHQIQTEAMRPQEQKDGKQLVDFVAEICLVFQSHSFREVDRNARLPKLPTTLGLGARVSKPS